MNKGYLEIRATCGLVSYERKLAAGRPLYIETYRDDTHEYNALFTLDSTSPFPLTITQYAITDLCENPS